MIKLTASMLTAALCASLAATSAHAAGPPNPAQCPRLSATETADRERTRPLAIPAEFRPIAQANVNSIAVATLSGGTFCVATGSIEKVDGVRLTSDKRFFHLAWYGNEAGGYYVVDRSGSGQLVDTGAIPTFSPSRQRFASIEISESGFGSLNGFLVMAVNATGMRQLAKLDNIPVLIDWRIQGWSGENCINLTGIRQEDVPQDWANLAKARRVRYFAQSGSRGWTLTRSTGGCPAA